MDALFRRYGFLLLDQLRGGTIARHMRRIEQFLNNPAARDAYLEAKSQVLLAHALEHVPHYHQYRGAKKLSDLPVLKKVTIQDDPNYFISVVHAPEKLIAKSTSGSYGTPLTYWMTQSDLALRHAEVAYFSAWAGYQVGMRHLFLNHRVETSPLGSLLLNQVHLDPTRIDLAWLERCRQLLMQGNFKTLIGQPTILEGITQHWADRGEDLKAARLTGIIAVAEQLQPEVAKRLQSFYGCPVLGRYACIEQGVLAQQCTTGGYYHLNPASHIIELVEIDSDKPVAKGQIGRVIVTNINNLAMPLLRYETGDLAIEGEGCSCGNGGRVFEQLVGRQVEMVYDTMGNMVQPLIVSTCVRLSRGRQHQFTQKGPKEYEISVVVAQDFCGEPTLLAHLREKFGADANISVKYVDAIPPLKSGKRPLVMNEYSRTTDKA